MIASLLSHTPSVSPVLFWALVSTGVRNTAWIYCKGTKEKASEWPGLGKGCWIGRQRNPGEATYFRVLPGTLLFLEGRRVWWHKYFLIPAEKSCWRVWWGQQPGRQLWQPRVSFAGQEGRVTVWLRGGAWWFSRAGFIPHYLSLLWDFSGDTQNRKKWYVCVWRGWGGCLAA